ncbi:MAG: glycosyltransferase [Ardenticatenaceae bacterium]|nr:glycosyltransferase [Anaerolineales bacterium]MCB8922699.1 glycosyltransferase [Ardenticatenaceae bacterium]MCB8991752.1 glycosyltransferase [Ardenticatenaceae bacterium]MCB9003593.1 glycosyltransferase [Ardenticatenaceae bacterium]
MITFLKCIYIFSVAGLSLFGTLGLLTLWLYWHHRHETFPTPEVPTEGLPSVTVQLPIYNERYVVKGLIETAVALQYPHHKLQIQVIDDSTDDTTQIAAKLIEYHRRQGANISLIHRTKRHGYKAGALANALNTATGEFVAIFDADFQPQSDFLLQTIPHFDNNPRLGAIQARWGHLNAQSSFLTRAQAIALDKHFAMEQTVRHRANLFPKFNGTAGIWRLACLEDAGGWLDDTVCEDLCLSTRAVIKQWEFRFLNDVEVPAELPTSILAYKTQQARWAKGSTQCLLKYGRPILNDKNHTLTARLYALLSMAGYTTHIFLLIMLLAQIPMLYLDYRLPPQLIFFSIAGIGQPLLFMLSQQALHTDWHKRLPYLPILLLIAVGMTLSNARAILQAIFNKNHAFIRTPKAGVNGSGPVKPIPYQLPFDPVIIGEIILSLYAGIGLILAIWRGNFGPIFFLLSIFIGSGYIAFLGLQELKHAQ